MTIGTQCLKNGNAKGINETTAVNELILNKD